jgi:hypothetical protein
MTKRHRDGLFIAQGACNPSAIALSIVEACREMRAEPGHTGTAQITSDPAIKLMVHQLAYICGVHNGVDDFSAKPDYHQCTAQCEKEG